VRHAARHAGKGCPADWRSDSLRDACQKLDLPVVLGLADRLRLPGQRFSRSRIVEVPRHKVDVEVRHRISEQLVVHVARREHMLDHLRDGVNVAPDAATSEVLKLVKCAT